jgi:oligoribonuclease NrnB/cAMP/cGMP phosphodiesterase (DHH superfamily)
MDTHIFYHSADLDGICSAAILNQHYLGTVFLHPINYGQDLPWQYIGFNDIVYVVDFSFPIPEMYRLQRECKKLIWIDHHKTAIDEHLSTSPCCPISGIREVGKSGCELTWTYMYPTVPMPGSVHLLGRYDVWDHSDKDVLPFQFGMRELDLRPESREWRDILADIGTDKIIETGTHIHNYDIQTKRRTIAGGAFLSYIANKKVLACNGSGGSELFADAPKTLLDEAEALVSFHWSGKSGLWEYGIYAAPGKDVDVSEIAKLYGGGGHRQASGFKSKEDIVIVNRVRTGQ